MCFPPRPVWSSRPRFWMAQMQLPPRVRFTCDFTRRWKESDSKPGGWLSQLRWRQPLGLGHSERVGGWHGTAFFPQSLPHLPPAAVPSAPRFSAALWWDSHWLLVSLFGNSYWSWIPGRPLTSYGSGSITWVVSSANGVARSPPRSAAPRVKLNHNAAVPSGADIRKISCRWFSCPWSLESAIFAGLKQWIISSPETSAPMCLQGTMCRQMAAVPGHRCQSELPLPPCTRRKGCLSSGIHSGNLLSRRLVT